MLRWTLTTDIDAAHDEVLRAVADERTLMAWSAWPEATGLKCAVESGDGTGVGSEIVFRNSSGAEQGRQRLTAVTDTRVEYRLDNRGPFGRRMRPELDFDIEPLAAERTRVRLNFRAVVPLPPGPRHIVERLMGARVRNLHQEDLRRLKAHAEGVARKR